jgi:mono/diheme cytochrome c family protein
MVNKRVTSNAADWIITGLAIFLFSLALAGCGASTPEPAAPDEPTSAERPEVPAAYSGKKNPLASSGDNLEAGRNVFQINCASCHGENGMGDGPAAGGLNPKPQTLMGTSLADDYLFWRISEGGAIEPFKSVMPSWKKTLTEEQIWQAIIYIRTLKPE